MRLTRISNAGLLVEAQGLRFLLDGLHGPDVPPYPGMDPAWEAALFSSAPPAHVLAFTHVHPDHFDPRRVLRYMEIHSQTLIYAGPDALSSLRSLGAESRRLLSWEDPGPLGLSAFPTRHIGPEFRNLPHCSLVLRAGKTLLFAGDASPVISNFSGPCAGLSTDILGAPFSYALGNAPFRVAQGVIRPGHVCVLHLPLPDDDPDGLRQRTLNGAAELPMDVKLMELGETVEFA